MGTCKQCQRPLLEVPIRVGETDFVMRRCTQCDVRQWSRDGVDVDVRDVIDLTADEAAEKKRRTNLRNA